MKIKQSRIEKPKVNVADTSDLTKSDWQQLRLTGLIVKGDRIIRTLSFMQRVERGAREEITRTARNVFA